MTGATPRVTVIVPTFNSGRHLGELIASLDRQSLSPEEFEVVLVDDGSSDGTETLVDRIAEARPNVRSTHIPPPAGRAGPATWGWTRPAASSSSSSTTTTTSATRRSSG
jgi:glycosyltransferase involved in cell wall biosynthesis